MHAVRKEDVPVRIFDFWVASDRYIDVSTAQHLIAGVERWLSDARFVRIEAYGKRYQAIPEQNDAADPAVRGDEFTLADGRSYGVDVLVRQLESRRLNGWLAYSYGVSTRERDGRRYFPAQDRRHNLNAVASYRSGRGYVFGARMGFGSGLPYTPIEGEIVRRTYDGGQNCFDCGIATRSIEPVGGERNSRRYPLYNRLDLSVTRAYRVRGALLSPYLSVVNAYNWPNVFIYTWNYSLHPPTSKSISQFPLLPTLGLTVQF
jgi:hypothetical protein